MTKLVFALVLALAGAPTCSLATDPEDRRGRRVGIIESEYLRSAPLVAPDTVAAGESFGVTVTTLGFHGCWRAAGAVVTREPGERTIVPYDRVVEGFCTQALVELPRVVELTFDAPGTGTIVLEGRGEGGQGRVRVEHVVVVLAGSAR